MPRLNIKWKDRLGVKLTAAIATVAVATVSVFAILTLMAQSRQLIGEVVRGAATFSDTIKSSTYQEMLAGKKDKAYSMMRAIGRQEGVERVRLFNKEGKITFSTDDVETGRHVDKKAESCYACHAAGQPIERLSMPSRSRIYRDPDGHRVLGMVTPIYNEESCWTAACHVHPQSQSVLGVVDIGLSLREIDGSIGSLQRRILTLAVAAVVLLSLITFLFVRRFVTRPVGRMVKGTELIAKGELGKELGIHGRDEIGILARSFDDMSRSLGEAREQVDKLLGGLEAQVEDRTAALKKAQDQLIQAEKMASLGKLAASITHEINNPLAGILTYAKLLIRNLEKGVPDEEGRKKAVTNLELVAREARRCSTIVRNLLDFARQRELALKEMDVNAALEEALSLMGHQMQMQEILLVKHLDVVPEVRGDFGQLRQIFLNIILNACEAMGRSGSLTVSSRHDEPAGRVIVEFADTGPGIPPDVMKRILEPFFTTKEKGTGLGLSVVYGIVERHGGELDIRSEVGKGTTVSIRLQLAETRGEAAAG